MIRSKEIKQILIKAIDDRIRIHLENLRFNTTLYGKVLNYSNNIATVEANENIYLCTCKISVKVNDIVRVIVPNNDYRKLYIDAVE